MGTCLQCGNKYPDPIYCVDCSLIISPIEVRDRLESEIAKLRQALAAAEGKERALWARMSEHCNRRSDRVVEWICWRGTANCTDLCRFDTCPLRKEGDCHETY